MEERIKVLLESLGLSKNEISVYMDLIKYPESSPTDITKRTGIYRSSVYESLDRLESRGFITKIVREDKTFFHIKDFENFSILVKQKEIEVNELVSLLKQLPIKKDSNSNKDIVEISHGELSLRNAFFTPLNFNDPIYILGAPKIATEFVGEAILDEYHKDRIKKQIPLKIIYSISYLKRIKELNKLPFTEARYIDFQKDSLISIVISGDNVYFFVFSESPLTIHIKDADLAKFMLSNFEHLWKEAKIDSDNKIVTLE